MHERSTDSFQIAESTAITTLSLKALIDKIYMTKVVVSQFFTFSLQTGCCFPRWPFNHRSQQWFGHPERVLLLVHLRNGEETFAQAAFWFGGPEAEAGLTLEAVPHVAAGLERAQSLLAARPVLIAGSVPATDHWLRWEALYVCDHPGPRPNLLPPALPFSPGPKPPTTPPSCPSLLLRTLC